MADRVDRVTSGGTAHESPPMPTSVRHLVAGRPARLVWRNQVGGLTYEVGADDQRCFVKWTPAGSGIDLNAEAVRLAWALTFSPVPRVLDQGADEAGSWLVTSPLLGENAVTRHWLARPAQAVEAIGRGLRALHDTQPVSQCPFTWSAGDRVADARRRAAAGHLNPDAWHDEHGSLTVDEALARLADPPPVDRLVVCHGDACAPNTIVGSDGSWVGHVDLGSLGLADRWADLAVATWSTVWNYGPGWEDALLHAYGVAPDPRRTAYYRLAWDLGP